MLFQKEQRLCLFMPPKNGTNTAMNFLKLTGWKMVKPLGHILPEHAIEEWPNLTQYNYLMFVRNPLNRFVSTILFNKQRDSERFQQVLDTCEIQESVETCSYEQVVDAFDHFKSTFKVLFFPQSRWATLPGTEVLDFDNYEAEIRRISGDYTNPLVVHNKSTDFGRSVVTQKVIDFVRQHYAADYALAKDRLGKEY
jgi:hypothetical protein